MLTIGSTPSTFVILGLDPRIHAVTVMKRDPAQWKTLILPALSAVATARDGRLV